VREAWVRSRRSMQLSGRGAGKRAGSEQASLSRTNTENARGGRSHAAVSHNVRRAAGFQLVPAIAAV
jgi:hypothetical protein